ncbi:Uncharacterized protein BP5553_06644 [Venustampulla echinocandica]|uniref:Tetraspanin Tsp3 n=1 Tax=Venustampulla echinocandica TaxID=2656787 RepID=A0A370TKH7_9HELO|nr:Uncharacterized protein BP5553_06644 [Venustampulla echinocandica]RDL36032.1 Uncharacterized protein BP5553_06644 [Venustampulla echinocandica]
MSSATRFVLFGGPILLLILTAVAGYSFSKIRSLSLPIPEALALFTVVLPIITGISVQSAYGIIQRSTRKKKHQIAIPLIAVVGFQLYETIVATLALTHMLPPSSLRCGLETKWGNLYRSKNAEAIRRIQDSLNCCGLNSVRDRAFPFGSPSHCDEVFGRSNSCFGEWRQQEQLHAGLLLLVALVVFAVKVVSITSFLSTSSWTRSGLLRYFKQLGFHNSGNQQEDSRAEIRGLIEEGSAPAPYRDDPTESAHSPPGSNTAESQGPRVEPSQLVDDRNEWRDEEQGHVA